MASMTNVGDNITEIEGRFRIEQTIPIARTDGADGTFTEWRLYSYDADADVWQLSEAFPTKDAAINAAVTQL